MWKTRRDFRKEIKEKQQEMYNLVKKRGINDPEVYSKSVELDCLIIEFMKKYNNYICYELFLDY